MVQWNRANHHFPSYSKWHTRSRQVLPIKVRKYYQFARISVYIYFGGEIIHFFLHICFARSCCVRLIMLASRTQSCVSFYCLVCKCLNVVACMIVCVCTVSKILYKTSNARTTPDRCARFSVKWNFVRCYSPSSLVLVLVALHFRWFFFFG